MASTYSTSLQIQLIANGEQSGIWGTTTNTNWNLIEEAVAGVKSITMINANYTLTVLNGVSDEARNMVLFVGGTNSAIRQIIAPLVPKVYLVYNNITGGYAITIGGSSGNLATIPNGGATIVFCDGTNFYSGISATAGNFSIAGNNTVAGNQSVGGNLTVTGTAAITGTSTLTGAVTISNGGSFSGTISGSPTYTGKPLFVGTTSSLSGQFTNSTELVTVTASAAGGTINYDVTTQSVLYYTTSATGNWTLNFRGSSGTSLNTAMSTGEAITVVFLAQQGSTAYYNNVVQIDGSTVTPVYDGQVAWSSGNANALDAYTYTIIKTGSATFKVLALQSAFA